MTGQQNVNIKPQNRQFNRGFKTLKHNLERSRLPAAVSDARHTAGDSINREIYEFKDRG